MRILGGLKRFMGKQPPPKKANALEKTVLLSYPWGNLKRSSPLKDKKLYKLGEKKWSPFLPIWKLRIKD